MGFRFRKSFGKGPFRMTVSKSGVGYSIGTKGARVTKKAGGGVRTTASIPGTGISYTSDVGGRRSTNKKKKKGGIGCLGSTIVTFLVLSLLASCVGGPDSDEAGVPEDDVAAQVQAEQPSGDNLQEPTEVPLVVVDTREQDDTVNMPDDPEGPPVEEQEETELPDFIEDTSSDETQETAVIVYITNTGSKYHRDGCRHLNNSKIETTLDAAVAQGLEPCGTCY